MLIKPPFHRASNQSTNNNVVDFKEAVFIEQNMQQDLYWRKSVFNYMLIKWYTDNTCFIRYITLGKYFAGE